MPFERCGEIWNFSTSGMCEMRRMSPHVWDSCVFVVTLVLSQFTHFCCKFVLSRFTNICVRKNDNYQVCLTQVCTLQVMYSSKIRFSPFLLYSPYVTRINETCWCWFGKSTVQWISIFSLNLHFFIFVNNCLVRNISLHLYWHLGL